MHPIQKRSQMTAAEFKMALHEAGFRVDHGRIVDVSGKCPGFTAVPIFRNGAVNRNATLCCRRSCAGESEIHDEAPFQGDGSPLPQRSGASGEASHFSMRKRIGPYSGATYAGHRPSPTGRAAVLSSPAVPGAVRVSAMSPAAPVLSSMHSLPRGKQVRYRFALLLLIIAALVILIATFWGWH
jgi:hypothetical protein